MFKNQQLAESLMDAFTNTTSLDVKLEMQHKLIDLIFKEELAEGRHVIGYDPRDFSFISVPMI